MTFVIRCLCSVILTTVSQNITVIHGCNVIVRREGNKEGEQESLVSAEFSH